MIEDSTARAMSQAASPVAMQVQSVVAAAPAEPEVVRKPNVLKNMALFLVAPFVGLVYAVLLPFVGVGMLAWALFSKSDAQKVATPPAAE